MKFQSTLPARGATRNGWNGKNQYVISIHAPRTGSDAEALFSLSDFSGFQSTLPARGATFSPEMPERIFSFQSTLPARGATERKIYCESPACISIHAPRTGSDAIAGAQLDVLQISIHAPRTGSDFGRKPDCRFRHISIHAPRTGSDGADDNQLPPAQFQSTLPARGATKPVTSVTWRLNIFQSTLPARGATRDNGECPGSGRHFNPRSPHGERRRSCRHLHRKWYFNPRSPHGERLC